jgi:ligand-binding sensor domain-containing protein
VAVAHQGFAWRAAVTLLAGWLLLVPAPTAAQPAGADLHYRVWTTEEGLPQGSVRAIAQTADGYLWLATLDGLVRFDGVRMTVLTSADAPLPSNRLTALQVDRQGALWIGTEDAGIVKKTAAGFRTYGPASGLPPGPVFALAADREGRLWASMTATWVMLVGERWVPAAPESLSGNGPLPADVEVPAVPAERRREQRTVRWTSDQGDRLWVLDGGVLHRRERGVWQTFSTPVPAVALPSPNALFVDREANLWIGCEQGLVQASLTPVRALIPAGPPDEQNVYTVAGDTTGRVWITTQGRPLLWERGTLTSLATKPWWPGGWMTTVEPDVDGSVLAAGPDAFFRVWPERRHETLPRVSLPHDFLRDRRGTLWLAAADGLYHLDGKAWQRAETVPADARVILEARDGALWIGTYFGLARVIDGTTRVWTTADGLSTNRIRALHQDEDGRLWIGTYDGGLNYFTGDRFVAIRRRDGLYDDGVFAIVDGGDGRYYMTSNRGVHSSTRRELEAFVAGTTRRISHKAWRSADGMPSSECNGWRQPAAFRGLDGALWFPTQKGIAVLHPWSVPPNSLAPPVVVEEATTERRRIASPDRIVLAPGERRLEVRFTANTFVRPEGARFRHRLEGFDDDWIETGSRRFAQYHDLPPGSYLLTIVAANSDGVWSPLGVKLPIRVEAVVWRTWWFRAIVALLALGLVGTLWLWRMSTQRPAAPEPPPATA